MRVVGAILMFIGALLSLTIIGAIIGIPLMVVGMALVLFGGRKTVITNVITVQNAPASPAAARAPGLEEPSPPRLGVRAVSGELPQSSPDQGERSREW